MEVPIARIAAWVYGVLAAGWRFSTRNWWNYEKAYILLAGMATPLVLSVHSVVSFDFAVSIVPGWHTTIFPPYFVAGAIYSGFAMVLTISIPLRKAYRLKDFITDRHLDNMARGVIDSRDVIFYSTLIAGALFLAVQSLKRQHA